MSGRNDPTSPMPHDENPMEKRFQPKQKVELDPPKEDAISEDYLAECDGAWELMLLR